jgi:hypothetical protein
MTPERQHLSQEDYERFSQWIKDQHRKRIEEFEEEVKQSPALERLFSIRETDTNDFTTFKL